MAPTRPNYHTAGAMDHVAQQMEAVAARMETAREPQVRQVLDATEKRLRQLDEELTRLHERLEGVLRVEPGPPGDTGMPFLPDELDKMAEPLCPLAQHLMHLENVARAAMHRLADIHRRLEL